MWLQKIISVLNMSLSALPSKYFVIYDGTDFSDRTVYYLIVMYLEVKLSLCLTN
jgi:hypothetical protein